MTNLFTAQQILHQYEVENEIQFKKSDWTHWRGIKTARVQEVVSSLWKHQDRKLSEGIPHTLQFFFLLKYYLILQWKKLYYIFHSFVVTIVLSQNKDQFSPIAPQRRTMVWIQSLPLMSSWRIGQFPSTLRISSFLLKKIVGSNI